MSLPKIAPLALLVAGVAVAVDQQQKAALQQVPNAAKEALDKANSLRNGDIGSALNQATSDMQGFASTVGNNVSGAIDTVSTKLGAGSISDFATDIGTGVNNAFGSANDALGAVNKVSGGLSEISSTISKLGIGGDLASGFQNAAARLGAAAGVLNNLLSLKRGINLAKGGELFQTDAPGITMSATNPNDWRVRIKAPFDLFGSNPLFDVLKETDGVVFPYLPEVTFSTSANYTQIDPVHNNYPYQAYKNSQVDAISIAGKFTAESEKDALYWIAATTFFKTSTKMFFGQGANQGNPPIICKLNGYGANVFNDVPVVVKSFSVDFPTDVDYIQCNSASQGAKPTWVPRQSTISIEVQPIYNRTKMRQFSLEAYANGTLQGYV